MSQPKGEHSSGVYLRLNMILRRAKSAGVCLVALYHFWSEERSQLGLYIAARIASVSELEFCRTLSSSEAAALPVEGVLRETIPYRFDFGCGCEFR